jgi:hypothetical protein
MAAISKSSTQFSSAQTVSTSGATSTNGLDNSIAFFALGIAGTIVNGTTGPTIACTVQLLISP